MRNAKPNNLLMMNCHNLAIRIDDKEEILTEVPYAEAISKIIYVMVRTRPDIGCPIGVCIYMDCI